MEQVDKQPNRKFSFGKLRSLFPANIMRAVIAADYTRALAQDAKMRGAARKRAIKPATVAA